MNTRRRTEMDFECVRHFYLADYTIILNDNITRVDRRNMTSLYAVSKNSTKLQYGMLCKRQQMKYQTMCGRRHWHWRRHCCHGNSAGIQPTART